MFLTVLAFELFPLIKLHVLVLERCVGLLKPLLVAGNVEL